MKKIFTTLILCCSFQFLFGQSLQSDVSEGCAPLTVKFTATPPDGTIKYYMWDITSNSNKFVTKADTTVTFLTSGYYYVTVYFFDQNYSYKGAAYTNINVQSPYIDFSKQNCPNAQISFNIYGNGINTCNWSFGDGTSKSGLGVSHSYTQTGKYPIAAIVSGVCGIDTLRDTVQIISNLRISGYLNSYISPKVVCPSQPVDFNAYSQNNYAVNIDFGDGTVSSGSNYTNHKYVAAGKYPVKVHFFNSCGNDSIIKDTVTVMENMSLANIKIVKSATNLCPNDQVDFNISGDIKSVVWSFDNGIQSRSSYPNTSFSTPGRHYISALVTNYCGNSTLLKDSVNIVNNLPISGYLGYYKSSNKVCPTELVSLSVYSQNNYHVQVDFGDGSPLIKSGYASKSYASAGVYPVTISYINGCGVDSMIRDTVRVIENKPWGSISLTKTKSESCPNEAVTFSVSGSYKSISWTFSDGGKGIGDNFNHVFTNVGKQYIAAKITSYCGNDTTLRDSVQIKNNLPIDVTINPYISDNICPYSTASFWYYGSSVASLKWDFGDGSSSNALDVNHVYTTYGKYPITLTLINGCGFDTVYSDTVHIINKPAIADFTLNQSKICTGDMVSIDMSADDYKSTRVDYGDGYFSSSLNDHQYQNAGTYHLKIDFTNNCGNTTTDSDSIVVVSSGIPMRGPIWWTVIPSSTQCPSDAFEFYTDNYSSVVWEFDGSQKYSQTSASIAFDKEGYHQVKLMLANGCGAGTTITDSVKVAGNVALSNLRIYPSTTQITPGSVIYFQAFTDASSVQWDFGDTITSSASVPSHIYRYPGVYYAKLKGMNACGYSLVDSVKIIVEDTVSVPVPLIKKYPAVTCPGDPVQFTANLNYSVDPNPYSYAFEWQFADGTEKGDIVYHSFANAGKQPFVLTVKDKAGKTASVKDTVEIGSDPNVNIINLEAGLQDKCPGDTAVFSVSSNKNPVTLDFGDGSSTTSFKQFENNGTKLWYTGHAYQQAGIYKVKASTTNGCGKVVIDSTAVSVNSYRKTTGLFNFANNHPFCRKETISFTIGFVDSTAIDFGDGQKAKLATSLYTTVNHVYANAGLYNVIVKMFDSCADTIVYTQQVEIGTCIAPETGVRNISSDLTTCFPNPVRDLLYIRFAQGTSADKTVYKLFDMNGRILRQGVIPKGTSEANINVNNIPTGIYILNVAAGNNNFITKIIKE